MISNRFFKKPWLFLLGWALLVLIFGQSCRTDFEYTASTGNLRFSKDTVYLDTIFATISSSTYTLKVYNDDDAPIQIPLIRLRNDTSNFRINVDGMVGNSFEDVPLLGNDSLFVYIETTLPKEELDTNEFLLVDALQFHGSGALQEVPLVSLVKDAEFLYPSSLSNGFTETLVVGADAEGNELRVEGFYLEDGELRFTNEKPYVIYGYAAVPTGKTLVIDPGARVHFHNDSGLIVSSGASLHVNGQLSEDPQLMENEVVFEGDRLEPQFSDVAGQWGTVWFFPGSTNTILEHLTVKNATVGLFCEGSSGSSSLDYRLNQVQVYNSSTTNLWARSATLHAQNSVFGNAGQHSVYLDFGGSYDFLHCTLANYWTSSFRNTPALSIDNYITLDSGAMLASDLQRAYFGNCVVDGNASVEFLVDQEEEGGFAFQFDHTSLRFDETRIGEFEDPNYDFTDTTKYKNSVLNINTGFVRPTDNNFTLGENSQLPGIGDPMLLDSLPTDILGNPREPPPASGAYARKMD